MPAASRGASSPRARMRVGERLADEQLHHEVRRAVVELAEIVDGDDRRMVDRCRRARLLEEARGEHGVGREIAAQHLHREQAIERDVTDLVDRAHAALAERRDDLVATVDDRVGERIARRIPRARPRARRRRTGQKAASRPKPVPHSGQRFTCTWRSLMVSAAVIRGIPGSTWHRARPLSETALPAPESASVHTPSVHTRSPLQSFVARARRVRSARRRVGAATARIAAALVKPNAPSDDERRCDEACRTTLSSLSASASKATSA